MAFPTTAVIDDFNRANSGSLGSNWGADPFNFAGANFDVLSNQAVGNNSAYCANYWSAATFGADSEVYVTCVTKPTNGGDWALGARIVNPDTTGVDGYRLQVDSDAGTDEWKVQRVDNGVVTQLGATATQEIASGDAVGLEVIGTTVKAYYKASGGSLSEVASRTDATYSAAGNISLEAFDNGGDPVFDDFGGGTVVGGGGGEATLRHWRGGLMGAGRF